MNKRILMSALLPALLAITPLTVTHAADSAPAAATAAKPQFPPEEMDRDGKHIVGYSLMTDSERNGYRSMLYFMKTLPERDAFRAEHRKTMEKRAKAKGVPLPE